MGLLGVQGSMGQASALGHLTEVLKSDATWRSDVPTGLVLTGSSALGTIRHPASPVSASAFQSRQYKIACGFPRTEEASGASRCQENCLFWIPKKSR